jgi:hypothetical protein
MLIAPAPEAPGAMVKLMLVGKAHGTVHLVGNLRAFAGGLPGSGLGHGPGRRFPGGTQGLKPRIGGPAWNLAISRPNCFRSRA